MLSSQMIRLFVLTVAVVLWQASTPESGLRNNPTDPGGTEFSVPTAAFTVNGAQSASTLEDAILDASSSTDPAGGALF